MGVVKPIPTEYKGIMFRSRLEARWALWFDLTGIKWEYEPEGYQLDNGEWYLPDFLLHNVPVCEGQQCTDMDLYIEVKRAKVELTDKERDKILGFIYDKNGEIQNPMLIVEGLPDEDMLEYMKQHEEQGYYRKTNGVPTYSAITVLGYAALLVPIRQPFERYHGFATSDYYYWHSESKAATIGFDAIKNAFSGNNRQVSVDDFFTDEMNFIAFGIETAFAMAEHCGYADGKYGFRNYAKSGTNKYLYTEIDKDPHTSREYRRAHMAGQKHLLFYDDPEGYFEFDDKVDMIVRLSKKPETEHIAKQYKKDLKKWFHGAYNKLPIYLRAEEHIGTGSEKAVNTIASILGRTSEDILNYYKNPITLSNSQLLKIALALRVEPWKLVWFD